MVSQGPSVLMLLYLFLVVLEFELRALNFLGRHSTS
jgi:hypothetical protein